MNTKNKGNECESLVVSYLQDKGHTILERNYRCPYGEIDVLSLSPSLELCVTEVKSITRRWEASEIRYSVDNAKKMRLRRTLGCYLGSDEVVKYNSIRFDVASVTGGVVTYYAGAF